MLSNAYFLAKFLFDTAENEPTKNLQNFKFNAEFANFANPRLGAGASSTVNTGFYRLLELFRGVFCPKFNGYERSMVPVGFLNFLHGRRPEFLQGSVFGSFNQMLSSRHDSNQSRLDPNQSINFRCFKKEKKLGIRA